MSRLIYAQGAFSSFPFIKGEFDSSRDRQVTIFIRGDIPQGTKGGHIAITGLLSRGEME